MIEASIPFKQELSHTCEFGMSVLQSHRNQGLGKQLLEALVNWAKESNLEIIELNVFSNNKAGINLYEKAGFVFDGIRKNYIKQEEKYCDLIHMSLYLGLTCESTE